MVEEKILQQLGLSEKQARVYLACLELGQGSVVEVSKKAGTKRPTTYLVLDELKQKGLVSELPKEKTTLFSAEDPIMLESKLKQSLKDFSQMLPYLRAKLGKGKKPRVRFHEGKEAMRKIYLSEIFPSDIIYAYGTSIRKFFDLFPDLFDIWAKYWRPKAKHKCVLEIVSNEPEDIKHAKKNIPISKVRILPKGMKFLADNVVTDNKVFIFSLDNLFAVVIESEDLATTYRTLVELAWESAVPVEEWVE